MAEIKHISILDLQYDKNCDVKSPVQDDYVRVVEHDEKGNEYITWKLFDSAAYQKSLGTVDNWSLTELLKAGIDPSFSIHTGYNTRLEGLSDIDAMAAVADSILAENNVEKID